MTIITGYGAIEKFDLDMNVEDVTKNIESFDVEPGVFIKKHELTKSGGGNILIGASLEGAMYEFEKAYMIIWSCGEYIDVGVIEK